MNKTVIYKKVKYYVQSTGHYFQSREHILGTRSLHRRIWIEHNGEIQEGMEIHHKDGNWRNNDINNLELCRRGEHMSHHAKELWANPETRERMVAGLEKAREAAREWHSSEDGRRWHSENGRKAWEGREKQPAICATCGAEFMTHFPDKAKHCSKSCTNRYARLNGKRHEKTCPICGKRFELSPFDVNKTRTCSRSCGAKLRWKESKGIQSGHVVA